MPEYSELPIRCCARCGPRAMLQQRTRFALRERRATAAAEERIMKMKRLIYGRRGGIACQSDVTTARPSVPALKERQCFRQAGTQHADPLTQVCTTPRRRLYSAGETTVLRRMLDIAGTCCHATPQACSPLRSIVDGERRVGVGNVAYRQSLIMRQRRAALFYVIASWHCRYANPVRQANTVAANSYSAARRTVTW